MLLIKFNQDCKSEKSYKAKDGVHVSHPYCTNKICLNVYLRNTVKPALKGNSILTNHCL